MTNLIVEAGGDAAPSLRKADRSARPAPLWLLIALALGLGLILSYSRVLAVWEKGTFFDSDDAMRLVEVRAFLNGQTWFDLTAYRLDPPHGVFMHWSRFIDLPLAALLKLFGTFLPQDFAERAMRLAFPLALQGLLYLGMARLAKALIGPAAVIPALVLTLLSGMEIGQFQPGRIHHSAPQILLLIVMSGSFIEAIDPKKSRRAALAGSLAALSLAIGLEGLPFIAMLVALGVAFWIWQGARVQRLLACFGLGLGFAQMAAFFATVGRAHWFDTVCDAYSISYLVPGLTAALVLGCLALATRQLPSLAARLAAAGVAAGLVIGAACAVKPVCFIDPYHGIDPLVRQLWLNNVVEGFSLRRLFAQDKGTAVMLMLPIGLGFVATLFACWRETGLARLRWLVVAALSLMAVALSFWMIRLLSFAALIALFGGVWCILALRDRLAHTRLREAAMLAFCLVLPFSTIFWTLVIPTKSDDADWHEGTGCLTSSAFAPLAQLPQGLVAAPIDAGSHLLAFTRLNVLAAPYHRNNAGNRAMIDAMLASPQEAHARLLAHHVTYLMTCAGLKETELFATRAPHGLAAALIAERPPGWLKPLPNAGPYHTYVIEP